MTVGHARTSMATRAMTTQSSPASDYLTVKSLIHRHAMDQQQNPSLYSAMSPGPPLQSRKSPPRSRKKGTINTNSQGNGLAPAVQEEHQTVRDRMASCRADPRTCNSLFDLLENFHQAFSEDQLWAVIFQFMTLYRDAIVQCGGGGGGEGSAGRRSSRQSHNDSGGGSSIAMTVTPVSSPTRRKSKGGSSSSSSSSGTSDRDSDGCTSDVEASDNSDIMNELMVGDRSKRRWTTAGHGGSSGCSSEVVIVPGAVGEVDDKGRQGVVDGEEDDVEINDNDSDSNAEDDGSDKGKPKSRLDHVDYLNVPKSLRNYRIHKDGSVHVSYVDEGEILWRRGSNLF